MTDDSRNRGVSASADVIGEQSQANGAAKQILEFCAGTRTKIAAAESLTGGLLADAFVRVPGASSVFLGSAVTYDIKAKHSILHVDAKLLERCGAVHPEVARQMALGARQIYAQPEYRDRVFSLSTTGVAGPGPDHGQPAGLVYVGFAIAGGFGDDGSPQVEVHQLNLQGSREHIRRQTVWCVLGIFRRFIEHSQE